MNNSVNGTITSNGLYINDTSSTTSYWSHYPHSFISNNIYYVASKSRIDSITTVNSGLVLQIKSSTNEFICESNNTAITATFQKKSIRLTASSTTAQIQIGSSGAAILSGYIKEVTLIDLTATFGSGNEPSKAWCDANLNYFDGSQNLNLSL